MQRYVMVENVRRFRDLLERERAPEKRLLLEKLLQEEEAKLRQLDGADEAPHG